MNQDAVFAMWAVGGVIVIAVILVLAVVISREKAKTEGRCEFDERQQLVRGKAFKAAYLTLSAYLVLAGCVDLAGFVWSDLFLCVFLGIFLSGTVFAICCIRGDAYISFRERPRSYAVTLGIVAASNLLVGSMDLADGSFFENGRLTSHAVNFIAGIMCAVILAVFLKKRAGDAKAEEK